MAFSIRNPWMVSIEDEVIRWSGSSDSRSPCTMFKVPTAIRQGSDKHYDPQLMYFGLYTYDGRRFSGGRWNRMEKFKREVANTLVGILKTQGKAHFNHWQDIDDVILGDFIWRDLCERLIPQESPWAYVEDLRVLKEEYFDPAPIWETRPEGDSVKLRDLCQMYDDAPEVPPDDARLMLILDAIFLVSFLIFLHALAVESNAPMNPLVRIFSQPGIGCNVNEIMADMWLFENQIPLSLIRDVLDAMYSAFGENVHKNTADKLLHMLVVDAIKSVLHILPGDCTSNSDVEVRLASIPFSECRHLLECLYRVIKTGSPNFNKQIISPVTDPIQSAEFASNEGRTLASNVVEIATEPVPDKVDLTAQEGIASATTSSLLSPVDHEVTVACRAQEENFPAVTDCPRSFHTAYDESKLKRVPQVWGVESELKLVRRSDGFVFVNRSYKGGVRRNVEHNIVATTKVKDFAEVPKSITSQEFRTPQVSEILKEPVFGFGTSTRGREKDGVKIFPSSFSQIGPGWFPPTTITLGASTSSLSKTTSPFPWTTSASGQATGAHLSGVNTSSELRQSAAKLWSPADTMHVFPQIAVYPPGYASSSKVLAPGRWRPSTSGAGAEPELELPKAAWSVFGSSRPIVNSRQHRNETESNFPTLFAKPLPGRNESETLYVPLAYRAPMPRRGAAPRLRPQPQRVLGEGDLTARMKVRKALGLPDQSQVTAAAKVEMVGPRSKRKYYSLPTVTNLQKAGIDVKGDPTPGCRIEFREGPWTLDKATLYISQLSIDNNTEKFLRNLIAYEIVSTQDNELLTYLSCMDDLIDDEEDVRLLKGGECPVITDSCLGEDKDVATMFNSLVHNCTIYHKEELHEIRQRVNAYYEKKWRHMCVEFCETHCSKPWIVISILGASVLLILTTLQTVYSVLGYYS